MITLLYNPFTRIAGWQALTAGLMVMMITAAGAYYTDIHFNGVIDAHFGPREILLFYIMETTFAWIIPVMVFYLSAFLLSKSRFRFIDIAGTIALARSPIFLVIIIAFFSHKHIQNLKPDMIDNTTIIVGLFMLLPVIWMIALMYHAFVISFNLKGARAAVGFAGGLLLAEIVSIPANHWLLHHIH